MIHVLLLVLKIIGIILLVLLALVILLLSLILFLPVRYQIKADYYGAPHAQIHLHWLLHLLRASATFDLENGIRYQVKVLWFSLMHSDAVEVEETNAGDDRKQEEKKSQEKKSEEKNSQEKKSEEMDLKERNPEYRNSENVNADSGAANQPRTTERVEEETSQRTQENISEKSSQEHHSEDSGKNKDILHIIMDKIHIVVSGVQHAADKILYIRERIVAAYEKFRQIVEDESNWEFVRFMKQQLKLVLSHIRPLRYNIYGKYGADTPDVTGKVTGVVAVVYAALDSGRTKGEFQFIPVFDEKVLELDVLLKGRIRLLTMLRIVVRVYRNKKFKEIFMHEG